MASGNAVIGFTLTAEGSGFVGAINISKQALKNLGDESQKTSKKTQASFDGISSAIKNMLGAVSVGAVGHFVASINAADASLIDLEKTTGIAAEQLARYDKAAALAGVSLNQIADYSIKLGQKLINAVEKPTGDAARAMRSLGFSATETAKLMENPGAALDTVAKRLATFENGTEKTAVAIALWGKQGKDLIPVLDDIAAHTRDVGSVSKEQAERAKYLTDQMALTKIKAQELGREFLSGLSPALASVAGAFEDVAAEQGTMQAFGDGVGGIFKGLATTAAVLSATIKNVAVDIAYLKEAASARGKFDASAAGDWDAMFGSGGNRAAEMNNALQTRNEMIAENTAAMETLLKKIWEEPKATEAALGASKKARLNYSNAILNQMDAAKALASQQASFIKGIKEENASVNLSEREKKKLQARNIGLGSSLDKLIDSLFDAKDALEAEKHAAKEAEEAQKKFIDAVLDRDEYLQSIERETSLLKLSAAERKVQIALLEAERKAYGLNAEEVEEYKAQVEAAIRNQIAVEENIKAQEELRNEWIKTGDQIEQAMTNALVDSLDDGKSAWDSFKDYIKKTAKTLAVRIPIQWLMGSLGGALGGVAGAASMGTGAYVADSAPSGGVDAGGLLRNVGTLFGNSGAMMSGGLAAGAGALGLNSLAGGAAWATVGNAGGLVGTLANAGYMFSGGISAATSAGGIGAGIGATLGTIASVMPYLAAAVAVVSILSSIFGKKGAPKSGGFAASENVGTDIGRYYTPNNQDDTARDMLGTVERGWRDVANSLQIAGSNVGFGIGFDTDPGGTADNRVAGGVYVDGERVYFNRENLGRDGEDFKEGVALEIQRMMLAAARAVADGELQAILGEFDIAGAALEEIQQSFADATYWQTAVAPLRGAIAATLGQAFTFAEIDELAREGETLQGTMERLQSVFAATNTAARLVGQSVDQVFGATGLSSVDARESLASRFGGTDAMAELLSYYASAFRPDESTQWALEEYGRSITSMFDQLGMAVPRTRDDFDALVRSLDLSSQSGQELFVSLMQIAPAFNEFIGALDDMSASMSNTIADLRRDIEYGGLPDPERYDKLKDEADKAWQEFQTVTDPAELQRLFDTITANMSETWNMLSDDQKNASRAEYLARLQELEDIKDQRIDAAKETYTAVDVANENIGKAGNTLAQAILDVAGKLGADLSGITLQTVGAGLSDDASATEPVNVENFSAALKPVLMDVSETNVDALLVLQAKLDEMNAGQTSEISAEGAKKDIESSGKNFGKDVQSAGTQFLEYIVEGARVWVAAAQTPQQVAIAVNYPQARAREAN